MPTCWQAPGDNPTLEDEMATRNASAQWSGDLKEGNGNMALGSGAWEGPYTYKSRFEEGAGPVTVYQPDGARGRAVALASYGNVIVAALVVDGDDKMEFRHSIIRDALLGSVSVARRRRLHREIAAVSAKPSRARGKARRRKANKK